MIEVLGVVNKRNKKQVKKKNKDKKNSFMQFLINNKNIIIGIILCLLDIGLIIYVARMNVANYVEINGEDVFVGDIKNLWLGRNYISLIVSGFIFIYGLIINKVFLKKKVSLKKMLLIFISILIFNIILFYLFTNRVY